MLCPLRGAHNGGGSNVSFAIVPDRHVRAPPPSIQNSQRDSAERSRIIIASRSRADISQIQTKRLLPVSSRVAHPASCADCLLSVIYCACGFNGQPVLQPAGWSIIPANIHGATVLLIRAARSRKKLARNWPPLIDCPSFWHCSEVDRFGGRLNRVYNSLAWGIRENWNCFFGKIFSIPVRRCSI